MLSRSLKTLFVAGARPNFMKIAPLIHATEARKSNKGAKSAIDWRLIHTGQHYDEKMSEIFFSQLNMPLPHINLDCGSGSHAVQTAAVMTRFEEVCDHERPDWVVVVGDVNSTLACTLVAVKKGIKVAHVEAGLRSFDRTMPEEINRIVTDSIADLLLTPSEDANGNLKREGVAGWKIRLVGNVMIDAVVANLERARASSVAKDLGVAAHEFVYVTLHRPSNVDDQKGLTTIVAELKSLAHKLRVVFPMHPRTRKMCDQFHLPLNGVKGLSVIDPIGYHDSLFLAEHARFVLTDSGGLQEETTFFRTPCLTLRPNTERPVTVTSGSNRLTSLGRLRRDIEDVLDRPARFGDVPPLWDGETAPRIIDSLVNYNGPAAS